MVNAIRGKKVFLFNRDLKLTSHLLHTFCNNPVNITHQFAQIITRHSGLRLLFDSSYRFG